MLKHVEEQLVPYSATLQAEELLTLTKPLFKFDSGESAQSLKDAWDVGPEPEAPGPDGVSKQRAVSFRFAVSKFESDPQVTFKSGPSSVSTARKAPRRSTIVFRTGTDNRIAELARTAAFGGFTNFSQSRPLDNTSQPKLSQHELELRQEAEEQDDFLRARVKRREKARSEEARKRKLNEERAKQEERDRRRHPGLQNRVKKVNVEKLPKEEDLLSYRLGEAVTEREARPIASAGEGKGPGTRSIKSEPSLHTKQDPGAHNGDKMFENFGGFAQGAPPRMEPGVKFVINGQETMGPAYNRGTRMTLQEYSKQAGRERGAARA